MKLSVLMENTALSPKFQCAHGLSLYFETPRHKLLFDAGPDDGFAANAEAFGIDLSQVDIAVLSHGHSDHGDGFVNFFQRNHHAPVYVHAGAGGNYYAQTPESRNYIGLTPALEPYRDRFVVVEGTYRIDEELTLFDAVPGDFPTMDTSRRLKAEAGDGTLVPDVFAHEQDLLITAEGKTVLAAGCAHRGIVNIRRRAEAVAGGPIDVIVGGFHLFQLDPEDPASDELLRRTGEALAEGSTRYCTGHCTGDYPLKALQTVLGRRLEPFSAGTEITL